MSDPTPKLFKGWLRLTKEMQENYFLEKYTFLENENFEDMTDRERIRYIKEQHLALIDEIQEAMGEISWKPWASADFLKREAFIGELVDGLHFIANMLCAVECTDEELASAYLEKAERNRGRMVNGYTGTDKCVDCKRAVDDLIAHKETIYVDVVEEGVICWSCERKRNPKDHRGYRAQ